MKKILPLLSVLLLLSGCGSTYNQPASNGGSLPTTKSGGDVTATPVNRYSEITTENGYSPTSEDISRYSNDLGKFLTSCVKGFSNYRKGLVVIDGKEADSFSGISLSRVKTVSVLEPKKAGPLYGTKAGYGAIVIKTK